MKVDIDDLHKIKAQHKQLGELIKAVCHTLKKKHRSDEYGSDELSVLLTKLLELTTFHFTEEESLMRRYAYEGLESHQRTHKVLLDRFVELEKETFIFDEETKARLLDFLEKDFCYHIIEDRKFWKAGSIITAIPQQ